MAQAARSYTTPIDTCELSLRLQLRAAGLRLERRGTGYLILVGNQVIFEGRRGAYELSLAEVVDFTTRALLR